MVGHFSSDYFCEIRVVEALSWAEAGTRRPEAEANVLDHWLGYGWWLQGQGSANDGAEVEEAEVCSSPKAMQETEVLGKQARE